MKLHYAKTFAQSSINFSSRTSEFLRRFSSLMRYLCLNCTMRSAVSGNYVKQDFFLNGFDIAAAFLKPSALKADHSYQGLANNMLLER